MAFRLLSGCAFFRAESEQNSSHLARLLRTTDAGDGSFSDAQFNAAQLIGTTAGVYNGDELVVRLGAINRRLDVSNFNRPSAGSLIRNDS